MKSVHRLILFAGLSFYLFASGCAKKDTVSMQKLEDQVRNILQIPGYEHVYRDIIYIGKEEKILGFQTLDKRVLFAIDVKVVAGIDAADGLSISALSPGSVVVKLPAAKILLIDAEEETIYQFFMREKGGRIERLEYYDEIEKSKARIREDAVKRGILIKAEGNVKKLITEFLTISGISDIRFEPVSKEL